MGIPGKVMYLEDSDLENVNLILQNSQEMVRFQTSRDRLDSKPSKNIVLELFSIKVLKFRLNWCVIKYFRNELLYLRFS